MSYINHNMSKCNIMTLSFQRQSGLVSLFWLLSTLMLLPSAWNTVNAFQPSPQQSWATLATRRTTSRSSLAYSPLRMSTSKQEQASTSSTSTKQTTSSKKRLPGTAQLDVPWQELGFEFRPTHSHIKLVYKDGAGWGEPELVQGEPYINVHIGATALHYGQSCFEG
jgi:hypothetical protein